MRGFRWLLLSAVILASLSASTAVLPYNACAAQSTGCPLGCGCSNSGDIFCNDLKCNGKCELRYVAAQ